MSDNLTMFLIVLCRSVGCCIAIGFAGWLAMNKIDGWGWFIFAAILFGAFSIKLNS